METRRHCGAAVGEAPAGAGVSPSRVRFVYVAGEFTFSYVPSVRTSRYGSP
ncbi:hypothetical protein GCM10020358_37540 [Amorphoplanes nipponensis]|uniref:hypothetical protein n=1 Tax=Actinoplanes nipponensis TaxID=135950 RepID=UPI0031F13B5A